MDKSGPFPNNQSGFLYLRCTVTYLLKNSDDWYNGLDLGNLVGLVSMDLIKVSNNVDDDILLENLPTMVSNPGNFPGFSPISPTANSFAELMVLTQILGI